MAQLRVFDLFPKSQQRPYLIETSATIKLVPTRQVKRWNYQKANWMKLSETLDVKASYLPSPASDPNSAYSAWCSAILFTAKKSIPRGCRPYLIPSKQACSQGQELPAHLSVVRVLKLGKDSQPLTK